MKHSAKYCSKSWALVIRFSVRRASVESTSLMRKNWMWSCLTWICRPVRMHRARALCYKLRAEDGNLPVIAYGWDKRRERAMEALQHGAVDFLEHPLDVQELRFALDAAYRRATLARDLNDARKLLPSAHVEGLLGNSPAMDQVNEVVRKVAGVFTTVLITGESGTGKGVVAQAIHRLEPKELSGHW